ncbi:MAG TPA: hypothetical protein VD994_15305, partial [Prosthecobacter sp.]|nr:hypothetical protein [Prosthecobacter sp.]
DLQRRVVQLEEKLSVSGKGKGKRKARGGWRKIAGAAKDDTHFAEAMRLGAAWRKKANKEDW